MRASLIIALAALALTSGVATTAVAGPKPASEQNAMATQASTLGRKVAAWQLSHMDNFDYTHGHRATPDPRGWVQGALFVGLAAFAERTGDPALAQAVRDHGVQQAWGL